MDTTLVFLGLAAAALAIPKLVSMANRRWFSDIEAMDQDYPQERDDTTWGGGGGHLGA